MADTRVDVVLALRTVLAGNPEALAYLDKFEQQGKRTAGNVSSEWDKLTRKLERKFSLPEIGYDLLKGFGIGSGFALIQSFFQQIEDRTKVAAEEMRQFADRVDKVGEAFDRIAEKRVSTWIESLGPTDRIAEKRKEIERLTRAIAEHEQEKDAAAAKVGASSTITGKLGTLWRGSPEAGDYSNFFQQFINQAAVDRETEEWAKRQGEIQQAAGESIAKLTEAKDALERSVAKDEKEVAQSGQKEADSDHERRVKALTAGLQQQEKAFDDLIDARKKAGEAWDKTGKEADSIRAQASAEAKLAQEIARVNALRGVANGLTNAEADAAIEKLRADSTAAARKQAQESAAAAAIRAAQDAVTSYDTALQKLAANPYLTDQEKQAQRLSLLQQQTQAIKDQQKALDDFIAAHPGADIGGVTSARAQLGDKETAVAVDTYKTQNPDALANRDQKSLRGLSDPALHYQTSGEGVAGGLISQIEQIGTAGDQSARAFQSAFSGATSSIQQGLMGIFNRTMSLGQGLRSIWVGFGQAALNALTQMVAEYAVKKAAMFALDVVFAAKGLALSAANAAKSLIMWIPSAIAASISSWGVAAAIGAAAVIGLVAANNFDVGGYTEKGPRDKPAGVVHAGEWVAPKWMVEDPVYGPTVAALEAARQGAPGYSLGGFIKKSTGWDTAGQFLGSGFIPKWAQPKFFTNFQRDWNLLDGQHLYGEPGKLSTVMDTRSAAQLDYEALMSPTASITRPAYQPDLGASGGGSGGASGASGDSGPVINQAFFNTQQDAETWLRSQEGRRFMVDFMRQNAAELS